MPETSTILTTEFAQRAKTEIYARLDKRIVEKGRTGFVNNDETYGKLCEELLEFQTSVWKRDDMNEKMSELEDIAVCCLWGLASIYSGWKNVDADWMDLAKSDLNTAIDRRFSRQSEPTGHFSEHESSGILTKAIHLFGQTEIESVRRLNLNAIAVAAVWGIASYHAGMKQKKKKDK